MKSIYLEKFPLNDCVFMNVQNEILAGSHLKSYLVSYDLIKNTTV